MKGNGNKVLNVLVLIALLVGLMACGTPTPAQIEAQRVREKWIITDRLTVEKGGAEFQSGLTFSSANVDLNGNDLILDADGDSILDEAADDAIRLTLGAATGTFSVLTGNLKVGNGTPGTTLNGEDAYIEGTLEVDDAVYFDGALDVDGAVTLNGTLDVDGNITSGTGAITITDDLVVTGITHLAVGTEHIGTMSIVSTAITYTAAAGGSGIVATIADGEIWIVHAVLVKITENFDCTGDDCTMTIGDGNVAAGFITLSDTEMQASDTEGTGFAPGWQGLVPATQGAYIDAAAGSHYFIYAPSGAAETIDWVVGEGSGTTMSAGAATIYVIYTRIQ